MKFKKLKINKDVVTVIAKVIVVLVAEASSMAVVANIVDDTMPEDASENYKKWSKLGGLIIAGIVGTASAKYALDIFDFSDTSMDMEVLKEVMKGTSFDKSE